VNPEPGLGVFPDRVFPMLLILLGFLPRD